MRSIVSLLDRLLETPANDLRQSVFRDLLWLLNTRRSTNTEIDLTVLDYGFPEVEDENLPAELKRTIEAFEPRLKNISIKTVDLSTVSANPFFGFGRSVDATGRDVASKRFRLGIVIEAELHGFEEEDFVTFEMVQDEDGCFLGE